MAGRGAVLVVGGSAGIGSAVAEEFARHGHDVVLVARDEERLARTGAGIAARFGVKVDRIALDAAKPEGAQRIASALDERGVSLSYAVSGIGRWHSGRAEEITPEELRQLFCVNVVAQQALQHVLLPRLPRGGGILFVGSLAGCLPVPGLSAYAASKAGLHASVLALRQETAGRGVSVCLLAPGLVATDFVPRSARSRWRWLADLLASSPETVARAAYRGLRSDVPVIVPGLLWRLLWLLLRLSPATLTAAITGTVWRWRTKGGPAARAG